MSDPVLSQWGLPLMASCTEYMSTCMPVTPYIEIRNLTKTLFKTSKILKLVIDGLVGRK